jgi:hypothetical protein
MSQAWIHPLTLKALYGRELARSFMRFKNPRRRAAGRHHVAFYQRTWREAAAKLGGTWTSLGSGIGEIEIDGRRTRVMENVSEVDDPVTLAVLHDKPLVHRLLKDEGIAVPRHAEFTIGEVAPAVAFLRSNDRDCVVKPAGGTGGGRGVTTGIRTLSHLARATAAAAVYGDELMIEEQLPGDNYRLLFLDGEMIDAFVRRLPTVVGDGKRTIGQLIREVNEERLQAGSDLSQVLLSVDFDVRRTLARQNRSLRTVPAVGQVVTVKTVVNENGGADNATATQLLCPSIVADCKRAVETLRVRFAGIDIVTPDPTRPLADVGGAVLEVNGTPNLYYHYKKKDGEFPVAIHLLQRLLLDASVTATAVGEMIR